MSNIKSEYEKCVCNNGQCDELPCLTGDQGYYIDRDILAYENL